MMNCPYCNKPLYHPTGKPTLSCANWNCMETDRIIGNHSAWEKIIELKSQLDKAKWWLNEIVENHRCTPISTAEMALKEITAMEQKDVK